LKRYVFEDPAAYYVEKTKGYEAKVSSLEKQIDSLKSIPVPAETRKKKKRKS